MSKYGTLKPKILELREKGMSYGEISEELGCAKSTVSFHCRNENLKEDTQSQEERKVCKCGGPKLRYSKTCKKCYVNTLDNGKTSKICVTCGGPKSKTKSGADCITCYHKKRSKKCLDNEKTISDMLYGPEKGHFNAYTRVRAHARQCSKIYGLYDNGCLNCGYSKHVQICHKKDIADFPKDTPLNVVNSKENLLPLCPNCHWEFDNDGLEIKNDKD